ncbi:hypothetical protein AMECASPLE_033010 [Ameca splendens]|uniref:Secreted protein n=1 Tax=Ameca splendens TaxID=208324 RepID=A0ABV1A3R2_9TELE
MCRCQVLPLLFSNMLLSLSGAKVTFKSTANTTVIACCLPKPTRVGLGRTTAAAATAKEEAGDGERQSRSVGAEL